MAAAQRHILRQMRDQQKIDVDTYYKLQEEIDWRELTLQPDEERQILEARAYPLNSQRSSCS